MTQKFETEVRSHIGTTGDPIWIQYCIREVARVYGESEKSQVQLLTKLLAERRTRLDAQSLFHNTRAS